jgi:hypothetical protein
MLIRLNDRLAAPNSERTLGEVRAAVTLAGQSIWGDGVTIEHHPSPRALFEVVVGGTGGTIAWEAMQRQLQG